MKQSISATELFRSRSDISALRTINSKYMTQSISTTELFQCRTDISALRTIKIHDTEYKHNGAISISVRY